MHRHHRSRRRIGVPKGLLHYISLKLLEKSPMSGSEITEKIEDFTNWRPSPGSVYPLLASLQEKGFIEPYPNAGPGLKQFIITEKGIEELKEIHQHSDHFRSRQKSMRKMYWIMHRNFTEEVYESLEQLLERIEAVHKTIESDEQRLKLKNILDKTTDAITEIEENSI
jgi:DNA-binding PadR family transcriptional regulator